MLAIIQQYRLLLLGLAVATLMTLSAAGAWQWQANAYGLQLAEQSSTHAHTLGEIARAAANQLQAQQDKRQALEQRQAVIDSQQHQELTDAQAENERLRRLYAGADAERKRLRIQATRPVRGDGVPTGTSAGSLGDGESVELTGAAGQSVWDIRAGIIADRAKLKYWQARACAVRPDLQGCSSSREIRAGE
ncbi:MAG: lysis system i-spanin subunit Rz [Variovorax sp.]